ncbi:MAG: flavodoxin family protein [Bacillota bacterium]
MKKIKILKFSDSYLINQMINNFKTEVKSQVIEKDFFNKLKFENEKYVIAYKVDDVGSNKSLMDFIRKIKKKNIKFKKCFSVLLTYSLDDLYTKTFTQQVVFLLNTSGLSFIGQPLIEVIEDYKNFRKWQKHYKNKDLKEILEINIKKLANRLKKFNDYVVKKPKILVLHASSYDTSNTLMLWKMIKKNLKGYEIKEIEIEDGKIVDCSGCPFETCLHYAKNKSCYYGGVIIEDILPAIEESDYIIWICPNYNDSVSAKLMAVINRMTVLYRRISLKKKVMYSVIISGNSGSDSVAKHLISALNLNKGFILPPNFSIMEIANDPGSIKSVKNIDKKAKEFAKKIKGDNYA